MKYFIDYHNYLWYIQFMEKILTKKQERILRFIERHVESHQCPPTITEIGENFGITIGTVQDHLSALKHKGFLNHRPNKARGIGLIRRSDEIPVYGRVIAGSPVFAEEHIEGTLERTRKQDGDVFALRVHGESMIEAGIREGDIIIVKRQQTADNGNIVVALLNGETTVKRYRVIRGKHCLEPANPGYQVIEGKDFEIIGIVTELRRMY